ncbi:MAG: hypothetical protein J5I93_28725, partial [Pirellulaceae bacterium]|nr:hypothetical protein [Pirellulaceae bacterium]
AARGQAAAPGAGHAPRYRLVGLDHRVRQVLRQKPARDRVSELLGSLLMSALVSAVLCVVLMVLGGRSLDGTIDSWSFYAWMVLSSVGGAWLILALGKLWEDQTADSVLRRFAMLVGGLAVGAGAFVASQVLLVEMSDAPSVSLPVSLRLPNHLTETLYAADGSPLLGAYVVYFGGLFLILRWWRQVDPLRKTRLSLWATAACALWAWILTMFWQFPQPWGFMLAMTISIAVQLASPWIGSEERERLGQRYREA